MSSSLYPTGHTVQYRAAAPSTHTHTNSHTGRGAEKRVHCSSPPSPSEPLHLLNNDRRKAWYDTGRCTGREGNTAVRGLEEGKAPTSSFPPTLVDRIRPPAFGVSDRRLSRARFSWVSLLEQPSTPWPSLSFSLALSVARLPWGGRARMATQHASRDPSELSRVERVVACQMSITKPGKRVKPVTNKPSEK